MIIKCLDSKFRMINEHIDENHPLINLEYNAYKYSIIILLIFQFSFIILSILIMGFRLQFGYTTEFLKKDPWVNYIIIIRQFLFLFVYQHGLYNFNNKQANAGIY
jgi:hypothetical protein